MENQMQIGETRERGTLRIHRFRPCLKLWDLTNAGKRGKRVRVAVVSAAHSQRDAEAEFMGRICCFLDGYTTLDRALSALRDFLVDFPGDLEITETEERGVDIAPAGFQEVSVHGKRVHARVDFDGFLIACLEDQANAPRIMQSGGRRNLARFREWFAANRKSLATMDLHGVMTSLRASDIDYHYWCTND